MPNEPSDPFSPPKQQVIPRATPARALFAFAAAFLGVALMTVIQSRQRGILEKSEAYTALGDRQYFALPPQFSWDQPIAFLKDDEMPLYLQSMQEVDKPDHQIHKVAWPRHRFHLYKDPLQEQEDVWYLKRAPGKYLLLGLSPATGDSETR